MELSPDVADKVAAPSVHARRHRFPYRAIGRVAILEFPRRRVRRLNQHEYAAPAFHFRDKRHQRVAALVRVDGHGIAVEVAVAEKRLSVCGRRRADIAALRIGDRNQAEPPRSLDDLAKRAHPVDSARFVKRKLRLDGDRGRRARLNDFAAEARERVAVRNSRCAWRVELRIDPEHDDAVLETRGLYKAIGKIHGYAVLHTVPRGSHRALRFRVRREHPLVDKRKN